MSRRQLLLIAILLLAACALPFLVSNYRTFQFNLVLVYAVALLGLTGISFSQDAVFQTRSLTPETALAAALAKRLAALGVEQGSPQSTEVYSIEGTVETAAAGQGREGLRIIWRVFAPDGTMLGGVSQMKLVRQGSLDKKWGRTADSAALDAAYRIAKLIPR